MTPDQLQKLRDRAELLVDIFLEESDPTTWPGNGVPVAEMSKQVRGDRYWCKKNAVATLAAAHRVSALVELEMRLASGQGGDTDAQAKEQARLDAMAAEAEKEAERIMKDLERGSRASARSKVAKKLHGDKA